MKLERCDFPDDLFYDEEGFVWAREEPHGEWTIGITSILAAVAGPITTVQTKVPGAEVARGKSVGTIESARHFGSVRSPVDGVLVAVNDAALGRPKTVSHDPYGLGWIARVRAVRSGDRGGLRSAADARPTFALQIASLRVHCYSAFPDHEMFEIGTECAAVMTKLDDLMSGIAVGDVVHLVSDDWTAPAEMENWSQRTGHPLVETGKEGNLYHFLVRKSGDVDATG